MANVDRRKFVGLAAMAPTLAWAQTPNNVGNKPALGTPRSVITEPQRDFSPGVATSTPDPDIVRLDPTFGSLLIGQATIRRIATGFHFLEGPAWSSQGHYTVFSDVKMDVLYRHIWETGAVTTFRSPSFTTNGNTFDFQGRQISTQDFFRRLVRWEMDGSMTVLADKFDGKPLNSPNDVAPHKDGSVWFTDPKNGAALAEGHPDEGGLRNPAIGNSGVGIGLAGSMKQVLPANVYRWDPSGRVDLVVPFETGLSANGICFSPDYTKIYLVRGGTLWVGDVAGQRIANLRQLTDNMIDGVRCGSDGMRCDIAGNIWSGASGPLGYAGVTVWNPEGKAIGRIRLPEPCANVCFAGPKRDWLFMAATSSVYLLRTNIQGASPG